MSPTLLIRVEDEGGAGPYQGRSNELRCTDFSYYMPKRQPIPTADEGLAGAWISMDDNPDEPDLIFGFADRTQLSRWWGREAQAELQAGGYLFNEIVAVRVLHGLHQVAFDPDTVVEV